MTGSSLPALLAIAPLGALELGDDLVPTSGRWDRDAGTARFMPRFASSAGAVLVVLGRADDAARWQELARLTAPGDPFASTTVVESIDPGVELIPANLLRFSVTFSGPMEEGSAAGRIHLFDAHGIEVPGALFAMPPELWDRERRRLTVLLEPGRIKRGLQPNVQAGAPLREGETVLLVVEPAIRDANGADLVRKAERSFIVGPPVRARVDPERWEMVWPVTSADRLVVRFDRPLDRTLVRRCLTVIDGDGRAVPGTAAIDHSSMTWTFTSSANGAGHAFRDSDLGASTWSLRIDTSLEDLAGNSVRRVLDRDLDDAGDTSIDGSHLILTRSGRGDSQVRTVRRART